MKDLGFGGNMYLVLFYDISLSSEGPERTKDSRVLRQVFKICKQYLRVVVIVCYHNYCIRKHK